MKPEDDARLQFELRRRNDLLSNALLLTRLTGMRIGETVDLSYDPLRHLGDNRWALHVPVGKLHSERWTPVDEEVRAVVARLRFMATLPPLAPGPFLFPRPPSRLKLCEDLRAALRQAATAAGIAAHIVPHQLRHTYATSMLRAGVSMPALMKLLGHRTANMTLRYVEITQEDLQREFHLAQKSPKHRLPWPLPAASFDPATAAVDTDSAPALLHHLSASIRLLDLFRQDHADQDKPLRLLLRRLNRVRSQLRKLAPLGQS